MVQSSPPKARSMNARTKTRRLTKIQERMRKVMFTPRVARLSRVGMVGDCWGWGCGRGRSADVLFLLFPDSSCSSSSSWTCSMLMFENRSRSRKKGGIQGSIAQVSCSLFFFCSLNPKYPATKLSPPLPSSCLAPGMRNERAMIDSTRTKRR